MAEPTLTLFGHAAAADPVIEWGPFRLIEKVGQGSFGEVYRAFDTTLQRQVALKLLLPAPADGDDRTQSLLREARAIARIRHANVVPVYGVDTHNGRVGFWSDYVNGKTLSAIIRDEGPFSAREAALIGVDLCRAVAAVHAAGLLHRDIKCSNTMRESGGRILLLDFGLTHEHDAAQALVGTAVYMAPEVLMGRAATVSVDIYALGILLFHLVSAKYPVDGETAETIRSAHESGLRNKLLDLRPDLPGPLAHVIERPPTPIRRSATRAPVR